MKIKRFNENSNNNIIYEYSKLYGEKYDNIDDIFKDLDKFDSMNIKYNIYKNPNKNLIGVFVPLPKDFLLDIPNDYTQHMTYDSIEDFNKNINPKNLIRREDILSVMQASKFNI